MLILPSESNHVRSHSNWFSPQFLSWFVTVPMTGVLNLTMMMGKRSVAHTGYRSTNGKQHVGVITSPPRYTVWRIGTVCFYRASQKKCLKNKWMFWAGHFFYLPKCTNKTKIIFFVKLPQHIFLGKHFFKFGEHFFLKGQIFPKLR
jgi:hypothetical protein